MKIWINADDYGWSESCSLAIFEAFQRGWLTTTTACVNGEYFEEAVRIIMDSPYFTKVGLHLNLTEGKPLTSEIRLCNRLCNGEKFIGFPTRQIPLSKADKIIVQNELFIQASKYSESGLSMNHIDSHHFIHNSISSFDLCLKIAEKFDCHKVRRLRNVGKISFFKKRIKEWYNHILKCRGMIYSDYFGSVEDYLSFQSGEKNAIFEIMVHPDFNYEGVLIDRENADYCNPVGKPLDRLIREVKWRGDTIL